jgi:hypothetical protein
MKYYYNLDGLGRIDYFSPEPAQPWNGELPEPANIEVSNPSSVIPGEHGVLNGAIVYIGRTPEELRVSGLGSKRSRIDQLSELLKSTDYRVIKCYEAQLRGIAMPYDLEDLLSERDSWREEINSLESEIASLQTGGAN